MNWKLLLHSLAAAAIGGAATGAATVLATTPTNWTAVKTAAASGALIGVAGLLKQSPLASNPPTVQPTQEPK